MELLQLKYFCTAAKLENITQAARHYGIPQPAMSQTISRLEKELGTLLFDRQGNRLYLNEKGKLFLSYAEKSLAGLESGITALQDTAGQLTGKISLRVLENRNLIIDLVSEFSALHPKAVFSISHDYYDHNFACDLCIASRSFRPNLRKSVPVIHEDILLAVPKNHRLAGQKAVGIRELEEESFVSMPPGSSLYQIPSERFQAMGVPLNATVICDDPFSVRRYVAMGMGIAFVPSLSWRGLIGDDTVLLPISDEGFSRTTFLFWDDSRYLSHIVRAFRDYIIGRIPGMFAQR